MNGKMNASTPSSSFSQVMWFQSHQTLRNPSTWSCKRTRGSCTAWWYYTSAFHQYVATWLLSLQPLVCNNTCRKYLCKFTCPGLSSFRAFQFLLCIYSTMNTILQCLHNFFLKRVSLSYYRPEIRTFVIMWARSFKFKLLNKSYHCRVWLLQDIKGKLNKSIA